MIAEQLERRSLRSAELRVEGSEASPKVYGYAARFGVTADIGGAFKETIKRGAFKKTLSDGADVRGLFNHNENFVFGRTKAGTLRLAEDDKGLRFEADPPPTQWAKDLIVSMKRGDISQCSFGFTVVKEDADYTARTRTLEEVKLFDISIVTFAAYPETSAAVRSAFAAKRKPEPWAELDALVERLKAGATLTADERRVLAKYAHDVEPTPQGWRALIAKKN